MARLLPAASYALAMTVAATATAEEADRPVDYAGPADCPSARTFLAKLGTRTPTTRLPDGPRLVVRITRPPLPHPEATAVHGDLRVKYPDGTEAKRSVDGESCESVSGALALMAAIALEQPSEPEPPPSPPSPPSPPLADHDVETVVDVDREPGTHVSLGGGGGAAFGMAPIASPDGSGFVEVSRGNEGVWSPTLRVTFEFAASGDAAVTGGGVTMDRTAALVDACPLRFGAGPIRILPCARLEGGSLVASGVGVTPDRSAVRPWVAAGLLGSVRYVTFRRLFVELSGGVRAPLVRDRFFFEPSGATVFQPPVISGFLGGGLGVTIL